MTETIQTLLKQLESLKSKTIGKGFMKNFNR